MRAVIGKGARNPVVIGPAASEGALQWLERQFTPVMLLEPIGEQTSDPTCFAYSPFCPDGCCRDIGPSRQKNPTKRIADVRFVLDR